MRATVLLALVVLIGCKQEPAGPQPAKPLRPRGLVVEETAPEPKAVAQTGFDGVVRAPDGGPIAAALTVRSGKGEPVTFRTDDAGAFSAPDLAAGEYTLEVRAPGQMPTKTAVYLPQHGYSVKLSAGHALSLTARMQLHGEDGADGPLLASGTVDVWWQETEQMAWEKLGSTAIVKNAATVRVPGGNVYLELNAQGRCGANFTTVTQDAALSVALDGEEAAGTLKPLTPPKQTSGWTVKAIPDSPSASPCLVRSVAVPADFAKAFALTTTDVGHLFRVEVVPPAKTPVLAVDGKLTGGTPFVVKWNVDGAALERAPAEH